MAEMTTELKVDNGYYKRTPCACHMGECKDRPFQCIEDLQYHVQEKHGAGYYQIRKPEGFDLRYPDSDSIPVSRGHQ